MTVYGLLECPLSDIGSKSEGRRAVLTDDEGRQYSLYRADVMPGSDPFFLQYEGRRIGVSGTDEPRTGDFLVESILLEDGTEVFPEPLVEEGLEDFPDGFVLPVPEASKNETVRSRKLSPRMRKVLLRAMKIQKRRIIKH